MNVRRTDSRDQDFAQLISKLDEDLAERDGKEHTFYQQFNSIENLSHVIIVYRDEIPIGCGAIKKYDQYSTEIKRMFTYPAFRNNGIATLILQELEKWTLELGYKSCILETGKRQPEAIRLYLKTGYQKIKNYGQYAGIENSICFRKSLS